MQRIFITGNAGTGKTTLSKQISKLLDIKSYGLDKIVWLPGWQMASTVDKAKKIAEITKQKTWIIDGVSESALKAADTIIFLDLPRRISYIRVIKRNWRYLFKSRPELPKNCPEILIVHHLFKIIWNFPVYVRPSILKHLRDNNEIKNIFHIRSKHNLNDFIALLTNEIQNNITTLVKT